MKIHHILHARYLLVIHIHKTDIRSLQPKLPAVAIVRQSGLSSVSCKALGLESL